MSNTNLLGKEITSYVDLDHRRMKFALGVIYQTDPDDAARIPAMLQEIVEANGGTFIRSGFIGFGPSSLDFERSEEHTSELQSLMRISYAVFCLKKKTIETYIEDDVVITT